MTKNSIYESVKEAKESVLNVIEYKEEYADGETVWRTKPTMEFFNSLVGLLNGKGEIRNKIAMLTVIGCGTLVEGGRYNSFNTPLTHLCCRRYATKAKEYRRGYVSGIFYDMRGNYHTYRVHKNGHLSIDPYTH